MASEYVRHGIGYNSEDEANLAREIPGIYLDRALDAGFIAEAVIDSDWLAAHDERVRTEERERCIKAVQSVYRADWNAYIAPISAIRAVSAEQEVQDHE